MSKRILIPTMPGDLHAYAVAEGLRRTGASPLVWHTSDFPHRRAETVRFTGPEVSVHIAEPGLDADSEPVDTVWNRRPVHRMDEEVLHPADLEFADASCEAFRRALFQVLAPDAFWVNDDRAVRRNSKLVQHHATLAVGLQAPDTVYTNDPAEIRDFLRRHGGKAVYKPLISRCWWSGGGTYRATYTSIVHEGNLVADELLQAVPSIYQALVPKAYELRVTVMGHHVVATRIRSQETQTGKLDWRKAYHELVMEPYELPRSLAARCIALLDALGLVFGCFDFVVTPDGEYVFLEVNQAGQFLFIEEATDEPLLAMFCDFLRESRPDFTWTAPRHPLRLADILPAVEAMHADIAANHAPGPKYAYHEPQTSEADVPSTDVAAAS
ncbi:hypothetical protein [Haliangium sp.]|uniref:hypothetical protein n=1 Tax=Haliangium sp. TaxID=2663208 RepID=UPI003D15257A